jgi:GH35 family endo-1,4-beta-xylanase
VGIEHLNPKSNGMLAIATKLHKQKLLDAVGFQCHFPAGHIPRKGMRTIKLLCALTALSKLITGRLPMDFASRLAEKSRAFYSSWWVICSANICIGFFVDLIPLGRGEL